MRKVEVTFYDLKTCSETKIEGLELYVLDIAEGVADPIFDALEILDKCLQVGDVQFGTGINVKKEN